MAGPGGLQTHRGGGKEPWLTRLATAHHLNPTRGF